MGSINKTTIAVVMGALGSVAQTFVPGMPPEVIAGLTTLVVALFVWLVPNTPAT
jgi:hypothetical protein